MHVNAPHVIYRFILNVLEQSHTHFHSTFITARRYTCGDKLVLRLQLTNVTSGTKHETDKYWVLHINTYMLYMFQSIA
jgi:hypothetical protein